MMMTTFRWSALVLVLSLSGSPVSPFQRPVSAPLLENLHSLWGAVRKEPSGWWQGPGQGFYYPSVARLAPHPGGAAEWQVDLELERPEFGQMSVVRREVEDFGLRLASGQIQVWWGGPRAGGVRVKQLGRTVAASPDHLTFHSHRLGLRFSSGRMQVLLDGRAVIRDVDVGRWPSGWLDLSARNSSVIWRSAALSPRLPPPAQETPPPVLRDDPPFGPFEAVHSGFQPFPSHLWNRWLSDFIPGATGWQGLPHLEGGESAVTHGPMLGKPAGDSIAVWCRTSRPVTVELIAGTTNFPASFEVLGEFRTDFQKGNTGFLTLSRWSLGRAEQADYALRVEGKIVDTRVNGEWPKLRRRWLEPPADRPVRLAFTSCDNTLPAPVTDTSMIPWEKRASSLDLMVHLGDFVYEQSYRRRVEVARLDYLTILSFGQGLRNRSLPLVGMVDDHELHNDVFGQGTPHWFAAPPEELKTPNINPWRIASRDPGQRAWDEFVGWSTPIEPPFDQAPVLLGTGLLRADGRLTVQDQSAQPNHAPRLDTVSTLIVWPEAVPHENEALAKEPAGVYRVLDIREGGKEWLLDPPPSRLAPGLAFPPAGFRVHFSVSRPRFGSLRLGPAELLILDTRTVKQFWKLDPEAPEASLLGAAQEEWLLRKIRTSTAPVLLIASSVTFTFHNSFSLAKRDSWTAFQHQRDKIMQAAAERGKPVVLLAGDLHNTGVRQHTETLFEIVAGGWNNERFKDLLESAEPAHRFQGNRILWVSPNNPARQDWESHATLLEAAPDGRVSVQILNVASDEIEFERTLVAPAR